MNSTRVGTAAVTGVPGRLVPLAAVGLADVAQVGRKAAVLGELMGMGYPVPPGFVIGADVYREARGSASELRVPDDVAAAIAGLITQADEWAVRSSGVAEDLDEASYAGVYETILGVRGLDAILAAVSRCWSSARTARVGAYDRFGGGDMAVLVQHLVAADVAGVAFSAHPVTGARDRVLVHAVAGLGERLVSGEVSPEQWLVGADGRVRTGGEPVLTESQAAEVAVLASAMEKLFGSPQDVEWAFAGGRLHLLQSRSITALPEQVTWDAPSPGGWLRNFRLGEWIGEPLTPLFDTWLLARLEQGFFDQYGEWFGLRVPLPHHVTVNGWYYATLPAPRTPSEALSLLSRMVVKLILSPRRVSAAFPPLAGLGMSLFVREWTEELLPAYREAVAEAEKEVEGLDRAGLIELVDRLGILAGRYFASVTVVAGYGWKTELPLARFYRTHLAGMEGDGHQTLLVGLSGDAQLPGHAVSNLDWLRPTIGELGTDHGGGPKWDGGPAREAEEERVRAALDPAKARKFDQLVSRAREAAIRRDAQIFWFTLAWPVLRRAVIRLGDELVAGGTLAERDDVFFVTADELIMGRPADLTEVARDRRSVWARQARLDPPPAVGRIPSLVRKMLEAADVTRVGEMPAGALKGEPASPGRVTAVARVIRSIEEGDRLAVGEVLVAPLTTPAWTPLFRRAAAVVTDVGSVIAHASLVAREYGIPAVVGTINATTVIQDGEVVTVDGRGGYVQRGVPG